MTKLNWWTASTVILLSAATAIATHAPVFRTVVQLAGPDGGFPLASVIQGTDGNLYGTTAAEGSGQGGTVFRVNRNGAMTVLYNFCTQRNCDDGSTPRANLLQAPNGNFYGTTSAGGAQGKGTVFEINHKGSLITLYSFCSQSNCADGAVPSAALVAATDGSFYGVTSAGGTNEDGTAFRITAGGTFTTSFCSQPNCADGVGSLTALVEGADGDFYGTTFAGGANNAGTVFHLARAGVLTTLYSFCSQPNCSDGYQPYAPLMQGMDGAFYGTTDGGGANGEGTVFKITLAGKLMTLYSFCAQPGCRDGQSPQAGLIQATDGSIYGTTASGGIKEEYCPYGCGTIFAISPAGILTTLHDFCEKAQCVDGYDPAAALLQATNGTFYGTTAQSYETGTVFSLNMGLGPFVTFLRFAGRVGQTGPILGQGFTGTTSVEINGVPANFKVVSDTYLSATVPPGATTGYVTVTTPTGVLKSNVPFRVIQ